MMVEIIRDLLVVCIAVNMVASARGHFLPSAIKYIKTVFQQSDAQENGCHGVDGLSPLQERWCRNHAKLMHPIAEGALLGLQECQRRFEYNRWNCSIPNSAAFENVMRYESRETAFLQAIQSAGMTLEISRLCSSGKAMEFCICDKSSYRDTNAVRNWVWGGCGDNFEKGYEYSRLFLDQQHNMPGRNVGDMMEVHNNEVGRLALKQTVKIVCKCIGFSLTCTRKVCWKSLPKLDGVGVILKERYDNAVRVSLSTDIPSQTALKPISPLPARKAFHDQLVHLRQPPNFCLANKTLAILGTADRECNINTHGKDSCEFLCCGNGNYVERTIVRKRCACRFVWCCDVECNTCLEAHRTYRCM